MVSVLLQKVLVTISGCISEMSANAVEKFSLLEVSPLELFPSNPLIFDFNFAFLATVAPALSSFLRDVMEL